VITAAVCCLLDLLHPAEILQAGSQVV